MPRNRNVVQLFPVDDILTAIASANHQHEQNGKPQQNIKAFVPQLVANGVAGYFKKNYSFSLEPVSKRPFLSNLGVRLKF